MITVNGEQKALNTVLSVHDFLESLGLNAKRIAVERNMEIVPKSRFKEVLLEDGDQLEIVHFIGGG